MTHDELLALIKVHVSDLGKKSKARTPRHHVQIRLKQAEQLGHYANMLIDCWKEKLNEGGEKE